MRISISAKVFLLFSTLTLMLLLLGVTSLFSYKTSVNSADRILVLKNFSIHLERLNVMTAQIFSDQTSAMEKDILYELEQVKSQIKDLSVLNFTHSPKIAGRFATLPEAFNHFQDAFLNLLAQYERHNRAHIIDYNVFSLMAQQAETLSNLDYKRFYQAVNTLWTQAVTIARNHDPDQYSDMKKTRENITRITNDPVINQAVTDLVHHIEVDLKLYSQVKPQELFLKNSSERFFMLINDGIRDIQQENTSLQARYRSILIISCIIAVCINFGLWVLISNYFNRFLRSQKNAIQAIEAENYNYDFLPPSNDEIGDLSIGMKSLAQNLSRARDRYRNIFFEAADAIAIIGMDGRIIDINTEACRMLGFSRGALLSKTAAQIDINLAYDDESLSYTHPLDPGQSVTLYRTLLRKDENLVPVEVKLSLINAELYDRLEGRIQIPETQVYLVFVRDITQRKAVEKSLRESEEKYRSMMETMKDPVYISDADYSVIYMNPAMMKRTGVNATGQKCFCAIHGLDDICPWCRHLQAGFGDDFSKDVLSPLDGRSYNVSGSSIVMSDETILNLYIFRDITEVRQLENQLLHAQKMESIGTLAGGIAHDFNNILFPIMGYTEMLLQDAPEKGRLRSHLEKIYTGAERARDLVSRILTFSRQDKGEVQLMEVPPVIHEALTLLRASIPSTIEIEVRISPDCEPVIADPVQIHQIVMNLATNAFHAMEESGGIMTIYLEPVIISLDSAQHLTVSEGRYNILTVSDTGIGMSDQVQEKIFDPYFTTKKQGKGTGMGLAVVHGIVTRMGGAVNVETRPGAGTTFRVYLPLPDQLDTSCENDDSHVLEGGFDLPEGNEHILVVDDEPDVMLIEKAMLERFGYRVTGMNHSVSALEAFCQSPDDFDLVITDLSMPVMSGTVLAGKLRGIRRDLPIIFCTGFSGKKISDIPGNPDLTGRLEKPIDVRQVILAVRSMLDQASQIRT